MSDEEYDDLGYLQSDKNLQDMLELQETIHKERLNNPSQFVSHWELDENIEEATEEERNRDPLKKLLWAAEMGNLDLVTEILTQDSDLINGKDDDGYTPLHRAAYEGHLLMVELLLKNGADCNAITNDAWNPLHSACFWNKKDVASILLDCGSDINAQTSGLQTPLHLSVQNSADAELLELLLMHPLIDTDLENNMGEKAITVARRNSKYYRLLTITKDYMNVL